MVLPSGPDALDMVVERYDELMDACEEGSAGVGECEKLPFSWRELLRHTGPGFLMCIAFVDPGNLEADLQTGAQTGYMLLWVVLLSTIMVRSLGLETNCWEYCGRSVTSCGIRSGAAWHASNDARTSSRSSPSVPLWQGYILQDLSSRLGVATGRGLASHCARRYSPPVRRFLWVMAELAVVGSDVQEVIGTAIALELLSGGSCPLPVGVVLSGFSAFGLLLLDRMGARWLDACFQAMVAVMALTMGALFCAAGTPFGQVAGGLFLPRLTREALPIACAMVGAIIMPHNLFLHSALVAARATERERLCAGRAGIAVGQRQVESPARAPKPADDSGTAATLSLPSLPPVRTTAAEGRSPDDEDSPAEGGVSETGPSSPSRLFSPTLGVRSPRLVRPSPSSRPAGAGALARAAMRYHAVESGVALAATLFINVCVVCVFAAGFAGTEGAEDIGLANAHAYLARVWGPRMGLVWGVGLLAAGQSSTMTGTYAGQFIMAGFIDLRVSPA
ncbi:natural resistance-associated macrophage protein, partial [Helicosporidium sp. ATCC 50920]